MNNMMLSLDETKVKLSNLTRINSIKNTNYCESLIKEEDFEADDETHNKKQEPVNFLLHHWLRLRLLQDIQSILFFIGQIVTANRYRKWFETA